MAAQQLQLALSTPNLTQVQRARYQARLDEVREYLMRTRIRHVSNSSNRRGTSRSARQPRLLCVEATRAGLRR